MLPLKPSKYSCFVFLFSSWGRITCFTVSFIVTWLQTSTSMNNVLVKNHNESKATGAQPKLSEKKSSKQKKYNQTLLCALCTWEIIIVVCWRTIWEPLLKLGNCERDSNSLDAIRWHDIHTSQNKLFNPLIQIKSSSTWLIHASLCEGPFFYFNVESPSSCFMHQLREHSCHS